MELDMKPVTGIDITEPRGPPEKGNDLVWSLSDDVYALKGTCNKCKGYFHGVDITMKSKN